MVAVFLTGLQEMMHSIFETSRLDQIFRTLPDIDAALVAADPDLT